MARVALVVPFDPIHLANPSNATQPPLRIACLAATTMPSAIRTVSRRADRSWATSSQSMVSSSSSSLSNSSSWSSPTQSCPDVLRISTNSNSSCRLSRVRALISTGGAASNETRGSARVSNSSSSKSSASRSTSG